MFWLGMIFYGITFNYEANLDIFIKFIYSHIWRQTGFIIVKSTNLTGDLVVVLNLIDNKILLTVILKYEQNYALHVRSSFY